MLTFFSVYIDKKPEDFTLFKEKSKIYADLICINDGRI